MIESKVTPNEDNILGLIVIPNILKGQHNSSFYTS